MPRYRWTGVGEFVVRLGREPVRVPSGETVDVPEHVAAGWAELERVADDTPGPDDWTAVATGTPPFAPGEHTVSELRDRVQEVDDADDLRALRTAEAEGEDRTTALDAIDTRIDDLED